MESEKLVVTLVTTKYFGRHGVIQKVTPKKFKIRLWDTGEETYLWKTSVKVLSNHSHQNGKQKADDTSSGNKRAKSTSGAEAKVKGVDHAVSELLGWVEGDGVTKDEWEEIVEKIGKMFI